MIPFFRDNQDLIQIKERVSSHYSPHLHNAIEFIYVTEGTLVLGEGIDLFEMQKGDIAVVFPNIIHHFQVFTEGENHAIHIIASPSFLTAYSEALKTKRPRNPVIRSADVHENIKYAIKNLMELRNADSDATDTTTLQHAFIQMMLARTIPNMELYDREDNIVHDTIYRTVTYIAMHYSENLTLASIAKELGISHYSLSRIFASTFHQNFNHYLNNIRLEYVTERLINTGEPITDIALDAGFQSQATFNRVFQEFYHMTPRQFRNEHNAG